MLALANDEVTEALLAKLREANIEEIQTIYTNDLDQGAYISQTLRIDETADQMAAQVAIYRMMRPGEPPTEEAVKALFNGLFYAPERYDLSVVGRMKFNRRIGRTELDGSTTCRMRISLPSSRFWSSFAMAGVKSMISITGNRRVRSVGELAENQFRSDWFGWNER